MQGESGTVQGDHEPIQQGYAKEHRKAPTTRLDRAGLV
jgi:hypothetical protein